MCGGVSAGAELLVVWSFSFRFLPLISYALGSLGFVFVWLVGSMLFGVSGIFVPFNFQAAYPPKPQVLLLLHVRGPHV